MADPMIDANRDAADDTDKALDGIAAVAPPEDADADETVPAARETPEVREGADAERVSALKRDPSDADAKLHVELDESFPGSDAPSSSRPGSGDPAPSSGYDEVAEKALAEKR